mmetsp:Transcript_30332/g.65192  ORF Transcript_30332/g.65192 Transcript_30332/m.65192 type:complete len:202 (+) Transcript_30332:1749-2354(+)
MLQQLVSWDALDSDLRDDPESAEAHTGQPEEAGVVALRELERAEARSMQLHPDEGFVHGRNTSAGAMRTHLHEASDLLLRYRCVVLERQPLRSERLDDFLHTCTRLNGHLHLLLVDGDDAVAQCHVEHITIAQTDAIRAERRAHHSQLASNRMCSTQHNVDSRCTVWLIVECRRRIMCCRPVGHDHAGLALDHFVGISTRN